MASSTIEEKIDIPESRKVDFRREIMKYITALTMRGKTFDYESNERLYNALAYKNGCSNASIVARSGCVRKAIAVVVDANIAASGENSELCSARAERRFMFAFLGFAWQSVSKFVLPP